MENYISGLANFLNFTVNGQLITWNGYNILAPNISLFSIGISSTYSKAPNGPISKAVVGALSVMCIIDQLDSEDVDNLTDTLRAFYNLCIKKERLPCLNLQLNNGVVLEITFTDLWSFRDSVKNIKAVCSHYAGIRSLVVRGGNVQLEQVISNGNTEIIEQNLYGLTSGGKDNEYKQSGKP